MSFWGFFNWGSSAGSASETYRSTEEDTVTANGALSYSTTGDARLDLFGKVCRDTPEENLVKMLDAAWEIDSLDTLRLIFYIRDCRGGTGERLQFFRTLNWLTKKCCPAVIANMKHVPFYGRYKDFLEIATTTTDASVCMAAYIWLATQLRIDQSLLGTTRAREITLAAKYAPSENGHYDKLNGDTQKMCFILCCDRKTYRKKYLSPLRKAINIVERQMTNLPEDWHKIDFSKVPAVALKKYKKAWERHEASRFANWLDAVKAGKVKMNVLRLMPHQIVEPYFTKKRVVTTPDNLVETQWAAFVDQTRINLHAAGTTLRVLSVIDTSGSMFENGEPAAITVALSLGLLLAELTEGPFAGKFVTFSDTPKIETIEGETLQEKLQGMSRAEWKGTTNIQAVYDLIINSAEDVDTVFVFSDMQWNCASDGKTNWQMLTQQFQLMGRKRPRFVFWNVTGKTLDFPIPSAEENACYISGFSANILETIIKGHNLSPIDLMLSVIRSERYDKITLPVF